MVRRALRGDGIDAEVEEASSYAAGFQALFSRRFDCAFLDYNLPDGSGLTLLRQIREAEVDIPIIIITGQGDESIAVQAMKSGATDYVTKDKAASAISQSLRTALRLHESERLRRRAEDKLQDNQEQFRLLVEGAKEYAIFMIDTQGDIASWNPGAERILGYSEQSITGKSANLLFTGEDRHAGIPEQILQTVLATGRAEDARWMRRCDESQFWAEGVVTTLYDRFGRRRGFEIVMRDATERKRSEEAVAEAHIKQRTFLRDVLASVTEGRLRLCESAEDMPTPFSPHGPEVPLTKSGGISYLRRQAEIAGREEGFSEERLADLVTAVGEAAMNAVVHAGYGTGQVCRQAGQTIQIWVHDTGGGIAVDQLPRATLQRGFTTAGTFGHGFKMLLQTADRLWLLTGPTGTTVVLEIDRIPPKSQWFETV